MNGPIDAAVIGAGPHAQALIDHQAPLGRVRLAAFSVSPGGADEAATYRLAERAAVPMRPWAEVAADPNIAAVLVLGATGMAVVAAALEAGKLVVCPPPIAMTDADLAVIKAAQQRGGGRLLPGGEIAHSEAGRRGLAALLDPEFGAVHSLYLSIRQPRGGNDDVLDALGWEALDFVSTAIPGSFTQVRVNAGSLFGPARDTAVVLLRSETDVVVTLDLARCLPPTLPSAGLGEIEIEAVGALQAVRISPSANAVQIYRDDGRRAVPWLDAPILSMLRAIEAATDAPDTDGGGIPQAARAVALMDRIRAAAAVVEPS